MLFRSDSQFIVVCVMPDFLHFIPVGDDAVLDWVLETENASLGLGFVANVRVFRAHANHDPNI